MKVAVVGSRNITEIDLKFYLPYDTTEIISGGAKGVDTVALEYAKKYAIKLTLFFPDYKRFGRSAPLKRNLQIIDYADIVIAFWDGKSRGTKYIIENCEKTQKECQVHIID